MKNFTIMLPSLWLLLSVIFHQSEGNAGVSRRDKLKNSSHTARKIQECPLLTDITTRTLKKTKKTKGSKKEKKAKETKKPKKTNAPEKPNRTKAPEKPKKTKAPIKLEKEHAFNRVSVFLICSQIDSKCDDDTQTNAEIVTGTDDGMIVIYSDSQTEQIGFVDISDPSTPMPLGTLKVDGKPTSVIVKGKYAIVVVDTSKDFINTSGVLVVVNIKARKIVTELDLGGQPDSVAISPDGRYIAIVIENKRDEKLGDGKPPQLPAGFLVVVKTSKHPRKWTINTVTLTDLDGLEFKSDPEPEHVAINDDNTAVVTFQENNGIALVDLSTLSVLDSFSVGKVDLDQIDTVEDGIIDLTSSLINIKREPDGVVWIGDNMFATADEGDIDGGSRGFTIFNVCGDVIYSSRNKLEHISVKMGHYPETRSENKGNEPENVSFGRFKGKDILFVVSERSSLVFVVDVSDPYNPIYLQALPTGVGPEGATTFPSRDLLVVASEVDWRARSMRSSLTIFQYEEGDTQYPTLVSKIENGTPIPWGAMSGLAPGIGNRLFSIEDSFYRKNRIFTISTDSYPAVITKATRIVDTNGVLAGISTMACSHPSWELIDQNIEFCDVDLEELINEDLTVNIDPEGIAALPNGGFWVVSEGEGSIDDSVNYPIKSINMLLKVSDDGDIEEVVLLPDDVNTKQKRFGFEGVAIDEEFVVVAFQRAWINEPNPRIGIYDTVQGTWDFLFYPLDEPESQYGGWVGLSDITPLGGMQFLVLERDNQGGPDASIKKIYRIDLSSFESGVTISKTLFRDIIPDLKVPHGLMYEKVEGLAATTDGHVWIINDNDGVDNNSGETQLLDLGKLL